MASRQQTLFDIPPAPTGQGFHRELRRFSGFGSPTRLQSTLVTVGGRQRLVPTYVNEFWTARQRQAQALQEVSYRACFKPQLPRFFIERLTEPGDAVYDPFMGRGTTPLEAALMGRRPLGCDVNPLCRVLVEPRLRPPTEQEVAARLATMEMNGPIEEYEELLTFYHRDTLAEIVGLRFELLEREATGSLGAVDRWIRMVAVNRLTGHSPGFFSVYTLPPNQAVSVAAQKKINAQRSQEPPRRSVAELIRRKTKSLLRGFADEQRRALRRVEEHGVLLTADASNTPALEDGSVDLVVTSPPFLDVVQYRIDNWLRCWFCGIDPDCVPLAIHRTIEDWQAAMFRVLAELFRVVRPGGHVAFEVGEVRKGTVRLEEHVLPAGVSAGFAPELVMINSQEFTKTANCWGVENNRAGTNTNRIVLFKRP